LARQNFWFDRPLIWFVLRNTLMLDHQIPATYQTSYQQMAAWVRPSWRYSSVVGLGIPFLWAEGGRKVKLPHHFTAEVRQPNDAVREHGTYWRDKGKAVGCVSPTALLFVAFGRAKRSVARRSLNHVNLAKAERLYKRTIYPPPAIQDRTDICAINAIMIRKSDLASLAVNCGSQQMNDLVFVKHKSVAAQIAGRSNRTSFAIGPAL
jgi:hypothetical protein